MDLMFGIATIDRLLINRPQLGLEMKKGCPLLLDSPFVWI
jgi:hypothetical protein